MCSEFIGIFFIIKLSMENYTSYSVQNILNIFTNFSVLKSIPENSWKILSFFRLLFFEFQPFPAQCFVLILLKQFLINSEHIAQSYGKLFFLPDVPVTFVTRMLQVNRTFFKIAISVSYLLRFYQEWLF